MRMLGLNLVHYDFEQVVWGKEKLLPHLPSFKVVSDNCMYGDITTTVEARGDTAKITKKMTNFYTVHIYYTLCRRGVIKRWPNVSLRKRERRYGLNMRKRLCKPTPHTHHCLFEAKISIIM